MEPFAGHPSEDDFRNPLVLRGALSYPFFGWEGFRLLK